MRTTRSTKITLRGIPRSSAGRVTVRGVSDLANGRAASARFRAIGPRVTRFGPLPVPPRIR